MAKTICFHGHGMWNGDGKTILNIYRVGFFNEYMKIHPSFRLMDGTNGYHLFDCVENYPQEYLDGWYCDECASVVVFVEHKRLDYVLMENAPEISFRDVQDWEEYIVSRESEFYEFMDAYVGKDPLTAIAEFPFRYRYKVSPDQKTVYGYNEDNMVVFGYKLVRRIVLP